MLNTPCALTSAQGRLIKQVKLSVGLAMEFFGSPVDPHFAAHKLAAFTERRVGLDSPQR
jgi:hypothetical protein